MRLTKLLTAGYWSPFTVVTCLLEMCVWVCCVKTKGTATHPSLLPHFVREFLKAILANEVNMGVMFLEKWLILIKC